MKRAVVLFNLGGPDNPEAVKPFLRNLFRDKAIISLPNPFRALLASFISSRRAPLAREIYAEIGGKSPLLEQTQNQAAVLEKMLTESAESNEEYRVFISMRYWHPMSRETVDNVKSWGAGEIILLPLYPQYSTTTTGSSFADWERECRRQGLNLPTRRICCYPQNPMLIQAHVEKIVSTLKKAEKKGHTPRLLFSAHGLPKKVVEAGDPYQLQVEMTTASIVDALAIENLDWQICYQSKVGPLAWLEPSTESEIKRAGNERVPLVIIPVAFVSEHSETLVELDIEYKKLADEAGVPGYYRVPALSSDEMFLRGLAKACLNAAPGTSSDQHKPYCSKEFGKCPCLSVA